MKTIKIEIPKEIEEIRQMAETCNSFIAGGAIRSIYNKEVVRDVDVFSKTKIAHIGFKAYLLSEGFTKLFENSTVVRFEKVTEGTKMVVDAVVPRSGKYLLTFGTPLEVISHFDFSVARAAILDSSSALVDDDFVHDCKQKVLRIVHIVCPLSTTQRIGKYGKQGYKASTTEVVKLFKAWSEREESDKILELIEKKDSLSKEELAELMEHVYVD